jgi:tetratricopeptide (TPR) repeat protein
LLAQQAGQYEESLQLMGEALALNPDDPDTLNSLAESYLGLGKIEQAIPHYRRALELQPDSADANCKLAHVLRLRGDLAEALRLSEYAVALNPRRFETFNELGLVLTDMENPGAAAEAFQRAVALNPDSALTALSLSYFYVKSGDIPAAADALRRAIKLDPKAHLSHVSLGAVLCMLGDWAGALECYERARALCPNSPDVSYYLGLLHLSLGNFALGWREHEEREGARRMRKKFSQPQWKGEPLQGARILLHAEQGLGDTLHFVRYVPLVAARGGQVVLAVQARLHRLLAGTEGAWQVILSDGGTVSDFHWHCPLLSLPLAFGTELSTIPDKIPYVYPDPPLVKAWEQRMQGNSLRVGLAWGGNPNYPHEFWRSILLEQLAPLTNLENTTFYSLQMGAPAEQVKQLGPRVHLIDLQNEQADFADTAAIVANLGLVISIDTSVAHLAGAMGKPVWILLHKSPDWRWLLEGEDSPWYPTARLFRQSTLGNWQDVVARVEGELRELVARTAVGTRNRGP